MFRKQRNVSLLPNYLILLLLAGFAIGPLVILSFNSVKDTTEIGANPLGPPTEIHLENFANAWREGNFATTVKNSVILVVATVIAELIFAGMAAYSLSRLHPPGENAFMLYMLVGSTLPVWLFLVPLFSLWRILGLINSLVGLIILYTAFNSPFSIFLLRSFMVQVPKDFDDAARVDGANTFQVFTRVLLPLTWPGFLTVGLIVGLGVWSEFQIALIFISKPDLFPVTTSYYNFTERFGRDWSLTSAAAVIMLAPILMLFLGLQRRFIDGLTQGGLKA
ncbi:MAG: carbohydrate ABC transporter permease [Caldilineaceae bacterium]|nr:carbohydrate ABC transporter permease [Caldilineaceae bacterium]